MTKAGGMAVNIIAHGAEYIGTLKTRVVILENRTKHQETSNVYTW